MNENLANQLKHEYFSWLQQKLVFSELSNAVEITTPFLNSNQDYVQIYATKDGNNLELTDDGSTINELYLVGFDFSSPKRKEIVNNIIRSYGVTLTDSGELLIRTTVEQFPQKKHALLQAILKVNDMLFLNRKNVSDVFQDDVRKYLRENDVPYNYNMGLVGKSGYQLMIDFAIPATRNHGEKFLQSYNVLDKNKVKLLLFAWDDVKGSRESDSSLYVIVNDTEKAIKDEDVTALQQYDVKVIPWKKRIDSLHLLTS